MPHVTRRVLVIGALVLPVLMQGCTLSPRRDPAPEVQTTAEQSAPEEQETVAPDPDPAPEEDVDTSRGFSGSEFSVSLPADWRRTTRDDELPSGVRDEGIFRGPVSDEGYVTTIQVVSQDAPSGVSYTKTAENEVEQARDRGRLILQSPRVTQVDGAPARSYVFSSSIRGTRISETTYLAFRLGRAYVVILATPSSRRLRDTAVLKDMLDSWEWR